MYTHAPPADHRTYRHAPALAPTLVLAALPLVALFAATHPALTVGLLVGAVVGRATR